MPKVEGPKRAAQEPGTVDHVRDSSDNGLEKPGILSGIVFQIRVLDYDDIARCLLETPAQGGSLSLVSFLKQDLEVGQIQDRSRVGEGKGTTFPFGPGHVKQELPGPVSGAVVDDNKLLFNVLEVNGLDAAERFDDKLPFIENGYDDGKLQLAPLTMTRASTTAIPSG